MTSESFATCEVAELLDADRRSIRTGDFEGWAEGAWNHHSVASVAELEPNVMEGAFGELEGTTGAPEQVVPELCVLGHEIDQSLWGGLCEVLELVD